MINKFIRFCLVLTPIAAVFLIVAELLVTNELAGLGKRVQQTDIAIDSYREENDILRQRVASASSLLTIENKARLMGFTESPKYIVIGKEEFALQQSR